MTATNHALTGAFLVIAIDKPYIALPVAFLSHFVIDILPHWDHRVPKKWQRVVDLGDLFLAGLLILLLIVVIDKSVLLVLAGAFLGTLPDAMWLPEILQGRSVRMEGDKFLLKVRRAHHKIQWSETTKGFIFEADWFVLILLLINGLR